MQDLGKKGESFVIHQFAEFNVDCIWGNGKTPSIEGVIRIKDEVFKTNLSLGVQIKTGNSYVHQSKKSKRHIILTKLEESDIRDWKASNIPVIVIWVSDDPSGKRYALWADTTRIKKGAKQIKILKTALVDRNCVPKLLEIARAYAGLPVVPILKETPLFPTLVKDVKKDARKFYEKWRRVKTVSPIFGHVRITLKAWRHITRIKSSQREICHKLSCLPCARELIMNANQCRFLRKIERDGAKEEENSRIIDDPKSVKELWSICGTHQSPFRADVLLEVVIEVERRGQNILKATFYSLHEKRTRGGIRAGSKRNSSNLQWI